MRSAALCRSLSNSINVQHYFVSIRKTFIDIFVALTELRKKNYYTHCTTKKTREILFSHEKATQFSLHKKNNAKFGLSIRQCGLSIRQLPAFGNWMLKCNASAVVVAAEKM